MSTKVLLPFFEVLMTTRTAITGCVRVTLKLDLNITLAVNNSIVF